MMRRPVHVRVRRVELPDRLPQHVDQLVVRGDPVQEGPVAGDGGRPVRAVEVLAPEVVPHEARALLEHLPPLRPRVEFAAEAAEVHRDFGVVAVGLMVRLLDPDLVPVAHHQAFAVSADGRAVAALDHHGQLAGLEGEVLDVVLHLALHPGTCRPEFSGGAQRQPDQAILGGLERGVAGRDDGQRHHAVLHAVEVEDHRGGGLLRGARVLGVSVLLPLVLLVLVLVVGLADRPAVRGGAERGGLGGPQRHEPRPRRVGEGQVEAEFVVGGVDGAAGEEAQVLPVRREHRREVVELAAGQRE